MSPLAMLFFNVEITSTPFIIFCLFLKVIFFLSSCDCGELPTEPLPVITKGPSERFAELSVYSATTLLCSLDPMSDRFLGEQTGLHFWKMKRI